MSVIEITNITRSYKMGESEIKALKGITLRIDEGEFVVITGHSGSGKSTLMHIIGLLDRPTSGSYLLLGRDVSRLSDDEGAVLRSQVIGFVFQMFNLLPRTSALSNVLLPTIYSSQRHRKERGQGLLHEVGLGNRMDHKPNQLSGGQQQRVAIARALVNNPQILLADEPTGNLPSNQANEILDQLVELNQQGITIIIVTHNPEIASYARRIIRIDDGIIIEDTSNVTTSKNREQGTSTISAPTMSSGVGIHSEAKLAAPRFSLAELKEHVGSALRAMSANKVRSFLSVLGVLIGVGGVIAMLAVGEGAKESIQARLLSLGSNVIMLFPGAPNTRGIQGAVGGYSRLTLEDAKAIQNASPNISDIYPEVEGNVRVVYKNNNAVTELQGVPISYESIRNAKPQLGRFFTEQDDLGRSRVVLLGQTVVHNLFGDQNPVGETVIINRQNFKVVGVLPAKGATGFSDQDDMIVIPLRTAMKRVLNTVYLHEMAIQCDSPDSIQAVMDDVGVALRNRHHLAINKENDFTLRNNAETQAALSNTTQTLSTLLGAVAVISLLVGGIGIMNIMLVSVNERTREIGLRKAVGAPRRAILVQFLLEASLLCALGGITGILLGVLASQAISLFAGWTTFVTLQSVVLAFMFSAGIGVIFGFWPAYQASLRSPIEALRYE